MSENNIEETGRSCLICHDGKVVKKTEMVLQLISFHCNNCGVMYEFPPPERVHLRERK